MDLEDSEFLEQSFVLEEKIKVIPKKSQIQLGSFL